ncbi:MAG TPA: tetratricopeptide repeat protein [Puia sp.]|jgi:tetratricopeptide (TPR) repeat protein|nr:tetratricopeptide repeat protein [Puia sp.]
MPKPLLSLILVFTALYTHAQTSKTDSLEQLLAKEKTDTGKVILLVKLSRAMLFNSPEQAMVQAQKGLHLARRAKFTKGEALCLNGISSIYQVTGNYPKGLEAVLESLKLAEMMHDDKILSRNLYNIGNIYNDQGDYSQALTFKFKSKQMAEALKDESSLTTILLGIGDTYETLDRLDSARLYTQQAYELAVRMKNVDLRGIALNNLGNIHSKMGQEELAMGYYRLSLADYRDQDDYEGICEISFGMAKLFQKQNQPDSTLYYSRQSLWLAQKYGFTPWILKASDYLTSFYRGSHKIDSAFAYQQITIAAKDSLFSQEKNREIQNLSFAEAMRQQELTERKLQEAETSKRNLQLAGIAVFIPSFFLFVLFLSHRKAKPRTVEFLGILALLLVFEFITLLVHPYIEHLTDDAPAIMLIILVAIAAFLVPLHHKMEKWVKERLAHRSLVKQLSIVEEDNLQPS